MAFKKIPNISISNANYGGFVYGLNYKNNFDESPSELTLQLISESNQYNPLPSLPPGQSVDATIKIGGEINFLCELWDWTINEAVGQRTLDLKFKDKSVRLDRIQVSLFKRNEGKGGTKFTQIKTVSKETTVPIFKAVNLQGGGTYYYFNFETDTNSVDISRELRRSISANYDIDKGGEIIIGEEQYIENTCSIPNVLYNFPQLLASCRDLVFIESVAGINPDYYNSYTGTLRQVLQNWCADFGLTFYWSTILNKAVIRDAKIPFVIPNENTFGQGSIIKKSFGESKDGTFAQYGQAWYEKEGQEARQVELSSTKYYPQYYFPFSLSFVYYQGNIFSTDGDALPDGADLRSESEFITSAMMSYYYQPFRKYYLWYEMGIVGTNPKGATPLGIQNMTQITDDDVISTLVSAFQQNNLQTTASFISQRADSFSDSCEFFIGYYDASIEENFVNYETDIISNYIGKYYRGPTTNYSSDTICDKNFFYKYSQQETPGGQTYAYYQGNPPPFSKFVRSSTQLSNIDDGEVGPIDKGAQYNVMERGGTFSHSQDEFFNELDLYGNEINIIDQYLPTYLKIDGQVKVVFDSLKAQGKLPGFDGDLNNLYFWMAPTKEKIQGDLGISVSYQGRRRNTNEQVAQLEVAANNGNGCAFTKFCVSEDEEVEAKIRAQKKQTVNGLLTNGQDQVPPVGLFQGGNQGYSVGVNYQGSNVSVVAPADGKFQGYSTITTEVQAIDKKENEEANGKIKIVKVGNIGNAGGAGEIRVVENNFTSEEVDDTSFADIKRKADSFVRGQTVSYLGPRKFLNVTSTEFLGMPSLNQGLESIETVIGSDGAEVTYNFANNPPKIPSPDVALARIENRKNRNSPR